MVIIGGLFGTGIFFYIRNAQFDATVGDSIEKSLKVAGDEIWKVGFSAALFADTDETRKDLEDLPRVVMAVRTKAKGFEPEITIVEVDPGKDLGAHQIVYRIRKDTVLVLRVRYDKPTGLFRFLEEKNGIKASRKDQEFLSPAIPDPPAAPGAVPAPIPPAAVPAPAVPSPAVPATPGEKVSEHP
jgi:hypothetical protein